MAFALSHCHNPFHKETTQCAAVQSNSLLKPVSWIQHFIIISGKFFPHLS